MANAKDPDLKKLSLTGRMIKNKIENMLTFELADNFRK